ncbi:MAG: metallophosphoesterase [Bacteroidales bacterium]|nr:metallophosphoesterase [Bacteroidales bacterium]
MKLGFAIVFCILISLITLTIIRGSQSLPAQSFWRTGYVTLSISMFILFIVGMIFGHKMPTEVAKIVSFVGNSYVIIFVYLAISLLLLDTILAINFFAKFAPNGLANFRFWWMMVSFAIIAIVMIIGNYNFNNPKTVSLTIQSDKPLQGKIMKIVAVSDLHLGFSIDKQRLKSFVKMINDQHPDLVLMAGDITDRSIEPVIRQNMREELSQIHSTLGVFAINGNHEHYAEQMNATENYLKSAGITFLKDSVAMVNQSFYIVGRDDRTNGNRQSLSTLVQGIQSNLPIILLDHQPHQLEEAEMNGIDLQFSGHTHEGQFFPGNLLVKRMFEIGHGYLKKGTTHYFVSSGLGIWGPQYRIGTQSEIVVIDFKY